MPVYAGNPDPKTIPAELLERWRKVPVAVAVDLSDILRQIDPSIRPLQPTGQQPALFGRAVTAGCAPPDFGAVLHAVDACESGDVLVIAADGFPGNAMIGEILGGHLRGKGVAGVVCDGAIRDAAALADWRNFPVFYRVINPRGPVGATEGSVNQAVTVGGTTVMPGDIIIGDDDGLIALSPTELEHWIGPAEERLETERSWRKHLEGGASMRSLFGLNEPLKPD